LAEFNYVAVLWADPVDRGEVHGLRWGNIEHAAVLAFTRKRTDAAASLSNRRNQI
jgi:hypothetical protein